MKAIAHPKVTHTLRSKRDNMGDLPMYSDGFTSVIAFEVNEEEIREIQKTGRVYLTIMHPPNRQFPALTISTEDPVPVIPIVRNITKI